MNVLPCLYHAPANASSLVSRYNSFESYLDSCRLRIDPSRTDPSQCYEMRLLPDTFSYYLICVTVQYILYTRLMLQLLKRIVVEARL